MTAPNTRLTFGLKRALAWCVVLGAWTFTALAAQQQTDPGRQVTALLVDAIRLLEGQRHVEFVKTYMRPSELEELVARFGTPENVAAEFVKEQRAAALLKALQAALKLEPTFEADGTRARYTFETPVGGERRLLLQKIGDRWYIRD